MSLENWVVHWYVQTHIVAHVYWQIGHIVNWRRHVKQPTAGNIIHVLSNSMTNNIIHLSINIKENHSNFFLLQKLIKSSAFIVFQQQKKVDNRNNLIQAGIPRKLVSKAVWIHKVTLAIGTFTLDWDFFLLLLSTFSKLQSWRPLAWKFHAW